jgi:hypothetical protein
LVAALGLALWRFGGDDVERGPGGDEYLPDGCGLSQPMSAPTAMLTLLLRSCSRSRPSVAEHPMLIDEVADLLGGLLRIRRRQDDGPNYVTP